MPLLNIENGDKTKALKLVDKALKIEPEYYLYHLRKAEWLFPEGKYTKALEKARGLAPADPWVLNMSGLAAMENQDFDEAQKCFLPLQSCCRMKMKLWSIILKPSIIPEILKSF